jgi:predicted Rossmann-fold nucleotide-binding protein
MYTGWSKILIKADYFFFISLVIGNDGVGFYSMNLLMYGGATVGCMGAVADGVMEAGGEAIGVIPKKLADVEIAHDHLTKLHVVETMHERKALMAEIAQMKNQKGHYKNKWE